MKWTFFSRKMLGYCTWLTSVLTIFFVFSNWLPRIVKRHRGTGIVTCGFVNATADQSLVISHYCEAKIRGEIYIGATFKSGIIRRKKLTKATFFFLFMHRLKSLDFARLSMYNGPTFTKSSLHNPFKLEKGNIHF